MLFVDIVKGVNYEARIKAMKIKFFKVYESLVQTFPWTDSCNKERQWVRNLNYWMSKNISEITSVTAEIQFSARDNMQSPEGRYFGALVKCSRTLQCNRSVLEDYLGDMAYFKFRQFGKIA